MKKGIFVIICLLSVNIVNAEVISLGSLLEDMLDRNSIAEYPAGDYTCRQVSSYDPKSKTPGNPDWFANDDWSNFVRCDEINGRREWVMMDVDGPGVIVRWWITGFKYKGTIRVYLDDSDEPVFQGKADKLIGGGILLGPPLNAEASRGRNLYLPIPYRKHCKITYDGPHARESKDFNDNIYYNINYRQYPKGTDIQTFSMADFKKNSELIENVQKQLLEPLANRMTVSKTVTGKKTVLSVGKSINRDLKGSGCISTLKIRIGAENIEQAMRSTVISAEFDGKQTVWVPIGEFFGTGVGLKPYKGWWREVGSDGWMSCYWPMPYKDAASVTITNYGNADVSVELGEIGVAEYQWTDRTMYFHASWRADEQIPVYGSDRSRMSDWNFITVKGKGVYAGDTLAVFNRANAWWGEGDEKVFVDGEQFPSHFGTGTEDYFGYAWCCSEYFTSPFHAQPEGFGNSKVGHSTNTRVRLLDIIPFTESIKFDMELWHWQATDIDYASTTYWYAFGGAIDNGEVMPEMAAAKVGKYNLLIEGEDTQLRRVSGGFTEPQKGNWGTSNGTHLWWKDAKVGDVLEFAFQLPGKGRYNATLQTITAIDYGCFCVTLDGRELIKSEDFYVPQGVNLRQIELGILQLDKGEHVFRFQVLKPNPKAKPGNMLGIDYIRLEQAE